MRRTRIGLFVLLFFSVAWFHHPVEYDNTSSRYYLLSAAVDFGRLDIDMYKDETIDVSVSGEHTYSNKAIGAPLLAAPVYAFLRRLTPLRHDEPLSMRAKYICRVVTTSLPHALLGVVLYGMMISAGAASGAAFYATLAYAFGSIAWIHGTIFSGHQLAACMAFFSFAMIRGASIEGCGRAWRWWMAGILAGLGGLSDYTAVYLAGVLTVYAFVRAPRLLAAVSFVAGGALTAALLFAYNTHCFGGPFSLSYAKLGYGQFAEGASRGLWGVTFPDFSALVALLVSPARGLFFIMPIFLVALPGIWIWILRCRSMPKSVSVSARYADIAVVIAAVTGYLIINAGFYGWHGGWTFGPRYLVPMLPFLALPMAFAVERGWLAALFAVSLAQVGLAQAAMPHSPEFFFNPWVECLWPLFGYGYAASNPGILLGLSPALSTLLFVVVSVLLVWFIRPDAEVQGEIHAGQMASWRVIYSLAICVIVGGLCLVRTPAPAAIHSYNARLLGHAAYATRSAQLARASIHEQMMTGAPRP